jgi:hypothetical protein
MSDLENCRLKTDISQQLLLNPNAKVALIFPTRLAQKPPHNTVQNSQLAVLVLSTVGKLDG